VRLEPPDWRITREKIEQALSPRTRLVIFNNPHNPTARLFGETELQAVAELCVERGLVAITDEVWEHIVFDSGKMVPLASLPGMRERTVKIGSAGKIFSLTGWKVGWITAPEQLAVPISKAHQFMTYATPPNLQAAVAYGLGKDQDYYSSMRAGFANARDSMERKLREAGFATLPAEGTYFLSVDLDASEVDTDDVTFCDRAVREAGVAAIPVSAFYDEDPVRSVIRLCFAKQPQTIDAGVEKLGRAKALFAR
jgi:aspartate/methionine/tyrosine aminotransferase